MMKKIIFATALVANSLAISAPNIMETPIPTMV